MESVAALVADYGVAILFVGTFLSCLALPVPSSLMMLTGGAFVAAGDLTLLPVIGAALAGAVAGDLTGYALARRLSSPIDGWIGRRPSRVRLMDRARGLTGRWGGPGVYLSRWLFSPLGPYVNLAAGLAGMGLLRFVIWDLAGETTWVLIYVGTGHAFAGSLSAAGEILGNASGLFAGAAVTVALGVALWRKTGKEAGDPHI